ncbi:hypothetical protein EGH25_05750 [Haladaptatus sp. F3-133]|jgi:hypothetical protein|uniref:Uncharacterized protein n=1 Tax=Halorutilus salinus TaxID=2487751 RepID=A0A9Q4C2W1_9EURY|nr:hypothetical protein [Halorutilus salinus]MCX2818850.1 hypothetical protein [Halorutilus salinus]
MRLREMRNEIEDSVDPPVEESMVLDSMGDTELEAPGGESETVAQVLERGGTETYGTTVELYESILGNLSEAYVGRKGYDDRGPNLEPKEHVSF